MILSQRQLEEIAASTTKDFNRFFFGDEADKPDRSALPTPIDQFAKNYWLIDSSSMEESVMFWMSEKEFRATLTPKQLDIYLNCIIGGQSKIDYANHYATIKKWLDEDSKGRSAKNYTYDDNEGECL